MTGHQVGMATASDLLIDALDRVKESVHAVVEGLDESQLTARLDPGANTIAWLVWHLTRVTDDHVADAAGSTQVWTGDGWAERFALPFEENAHGYGQTADDVAQVRVPAELLAGYQDATHARAVAYVGELDAADYDRIVDERWDPPVTLAVRLLSVVNDATQHAGQAAFVRGVIERTS